MPFPCMNSASKAFLAKLTLKNRKKESVICRKTGRWLSGRSGGSRKLKGRGWEGCEKNPGTEGPWAPSPTALPVAEEEGGQRGGLGPPGCYPSPETGAGPSSPCFPSSLLFWQVTQAPGGPAVSIVGNLAIQLI